MSESAEAIGYLQQGQAIGSAADINAQLALSRGAKEAEQIHQRGDRHVGKMRAAIGKAGVAMSGSAKLAITEAIRTSKEDALQAQFNAEREAIIQRSKARSARSAAKLRAASTLVQGGIGYYMDHKSLE